LVDRSGQVITSKSCEGGILHVATDNPAVPGLAMVKKSDGITYLFAQSSARSPSGARFSFALSGLAGRVATVIYDSNSRYDRAHAALGETTPLDGAGRFADTFGAHADDYQVKIYAIK
jgi:hypothetical protein